MLSRRILLLLPLALLYGCRSEPRPIDPIWGKQPCAHCRMLVGDRRYAAQALSAQGERVYFDDVGCLASYLAGHKGWQGWVRDGTGGWLHAASARYRRGAATPMDYGFAVDAEGELDFSVVSAAVLRRDQQGDT